MTTNNNNDNNPIYFRPGIAPVHHRISRIKRIVPNPRLPPGVRTDDMPEEIDVEPPSEGVHDLSSDLGEGPNRRAIFNFSEFFRRPNERQDPLWTNPEYRQRLLNILNITRQRERVRDRARRRMGRLPADVMRPDELDHVYETLLQQRNPYMSEPEMLSPSEIDPQIFGRNGPNDFDPFVIYPSLEEPPSRQGTSYHLNYLPPPPPVPEDPINYP